MHVALRSDAMILGRSFMACIGNTKKSARRVATIERRAGA